MDHSEHHDYSHNMMNQSAGSDAHVHDGHHGTMDHSMHDHVVGTQMPPMVGHAGHGSHNAGGMEGMVHHMMSMSFHGGYNETILFEQWKIDSLSGLLWSMLLIFIMAALYEGLKYYREHLFWKTYNALQYRPVTVTEKSPRNGTVSNNNETVVNGGGGDGDDGSRIVQPTMLSIMHLYQTFLHILQVTLSFLLMLIFMTYNTWLCVAVVLGAALGYFLFGWKKSVVVDVTEHCH
ncbi:high affinity copper uptake protein 1 isoform X2 [Topomyia yanbarensis]|uniref:high affinity copper uptake protein 1 isoform X2 n=1 Tax=Topomyia yanbarensis TaxID=2498891 RepID=UPI00273B06F8|nr:high affinity copper uptake protein 1 isoform X2 [Topomyia yanbarensis]